MLRKTFQKIKEHKRRLTSNGCLSVPGKPGPIFSNRIPVLNHPDSTSCTKNSVWQKFTFKKNNSKSWLKIKGCWKDVLRSDKTCSLIINNHNHKLTKFLNLICPNFCIGCNRSHYASCLGQYAPSSARFWMFFSLLAKTFEISCFLI